MEWVVARREESWASPPMSNSGLRSLEQSGVGHLPDSFHVGLNSVQGSFWNSSVNAAYLNM